MKISDFKVIYICPDNNEKYHKRKLHMDILLNKLGCQQIEHFKSSTENYPACLNKAIIEILENNLDIPFILLEDDIEWTGIEDFKFDNNCDALYLGISKSGGHPTNNIHLGESIFEKWSDSQARVLNMLSGHAILFNTKKYKEAVIKLFKEYSNLSYHTDILLSRLQSSYLILANKKPLFYQSTKFDNTQHVENWTNFEINI